MRSPLGHLLRPEERERIGIELGHANDRGPICDVLQHTLGGQRHEGIQGWHHRPSWFFPDQLAENHQIWWIRAPIRPN
jgi:hypothetical protein